MPCFRYTLNTICKPNQSDSPYNCTLNSVCRRLNSDQPSYPASPSPHSHRPSPRCTLIADPLWHSIQRCTMMSPMNEQVLVSNSEHALMHLACIMRRRKPTDAGCRLSFSQIPGPCGAHPCVCFYAAAAAAAADSIAIARCTSTAATGFDRYP